MKRLFCGLILVTALTVTGCASNDARLADHYAPPIEARADCLARAPEGAGALRQPHVEAQPIWCRDAREEVAVHIGQREHMPAPDFRRRGDPEDE